MSTQSVPFETLLDLAMGLDRSWMQWGTCRGWARKTENEGDVNPWFVANNESFGDHGEIKGHELIEWALMHCAGCVAQYDCATFAVRTRCDVGTSSMPIGSLRWLQAQEDWAEIVDIAEVHSIPVQQAVVAVRRVRQV